MKPTDCAEAVGFLATVTWPAAFLVVGVAAAAAFAAWALFKAAS